MSTIWTPGGEYVPRATDPTAEAASAGATAGPSTSEPPPTRRSRDAGDAGDMSDEELQAELARARAELAATPVADVVANHAVGLWQLAVLHLTPDGNRRPDLEQARLAIDALAALLDGVGGRLGEHGPALRDALAQLQLAFVQRGT